MAEGQESVYVVLDLEGAVDIPPPGCKLLLEGMETTQPTLRLADGTRLLGTFEQTVGEQLVLSDAVQQDDSHRVQLLAHTDKRITFRRAQAAEGAALTEEEGPAGTTEGGSEAVGRAGAAEAMDGPTTGIEQLQQQQQQQERQQQQQGGGAT